MSELSLRDWCGIGVIICGLVSIAYSLRTMRELKKIEGKL
jgi:hypothetical protein